MACVAIITEGCIRVGWARGWRDSQAAQGEADGSP